MHPLVVSKAKLGLIWSTLLVVALLAFILSLLKKKDNSLLLFSSKGGYAKLNEYVDQSSSPIAHNINSSH